VDCCSKHFTFIFHEHTLNRQMGKFSKCTPYPGYRK